MKVGSLVELVYDNWYLLEKLSKLGVVYPVKGKIYTIREIVFSQEGCGVLLEEIINPKIHNTRNGMVEHGFRIERFRELLPPMQISIEEILEETV